ncbi:classical arabinogalactan protein 26-like [Salvia divinorum]|uniref:Classical arabinogalactan protein 26-like n=1 Tax=Salvia divinorum TaxID=28513 RepID=A0ABD1GGA8_SALDI
MAFPNLLITTTLFLSLTLSPAPSHQTSARTPTISAAPALLPLPPDAPLSPDVAPLLPSPGGSSMPTIPSTRSQNPDMLDPVGPDTALAPFGSLPESAAVEIPIRGFGSGFFICLVVFMI